MEFHLIFALYSPALKLRNFTLTPVHSLALHSQLGHYECTYVHRCPKLELELDLASCGAVGNRQLNAMHLLHLVYDLQQQHNNICTT
jgi:hypothetical protein